MKVGQITNVNFFDNKKFVIGKIMNGGMGVVYQLVPIRTYLSPVALKTLQCIMTVQDFEK
jgi:hypothetical protein